MSVTISLQMKEIPDIDNDHKLTIPCKTDSFALRIRISKYSSRYHCSIGCKHFLEHLNKQRMF